MIRRLILVLAFASATPAWAQGESPQLALAQRLIENSGAQGLFEPVASEHGLSARHVGSGLTCHFDDVASGRIVLYGSRPRGDDVSCETRRTGETISLYATRYPEGTTLLDQLNGAGAAIQQRFPDARLYRPEIRAEVEGLPQRGEAHFLITIEGERHLTMTSVAMVGEWVIKARYTGSAADADTLRQRELVASILLISALIEIEPAARQQP